MGRHKALVIHDDPRIVDELSEIFASLGHEHDWARSQEEARVRLAADGYSYIVMDLEIPARSKRGAASVGNGLNLLEEVLAFYRTNDVPVIVLVSCRPKARMSLADVAELAARVMGKGAAYVVRKPVGGGPRRLDGAIKKVLSNAHISSRDNRTTVTPTAPKPFEGGEMVFYPDRVELCGVKVLGDIGAGQTRRLIQELSRKGSHDRFVCRSGAQLAKAIESDGGQNSVAGCVRNFRKNVARALAEKGIVCGLQDVIQSGGQGYRLREWITVREMGLAVSAKT